MSGGRLRLKRRGEQEPCREQKRQGREATSACCSSAAPATALPPIGLLNAGNTCFLNVIVHMLRQVRPVCKLLLELRPEEAQSSLPLALQQLLREMEEVTFVRATLQVNLAQAEGALLPTQVLASLQTEYGMCDGAQQDAHELLVRLLEALPQSARLLFRAVSVHSTRCQECEEVSTHEEAACGLSLNVEENASINFLLYSRSSIQLLAGADKYACPQCHTYVEAARWTSFSPPYPPYLMIHLMQPGLSTNIQTTLSDHICIGSERDTRSRRGSSRTYELLAVILRSHLSDALGHYSVICRSGSGWIHFDDSHVSLLCRLHVHKFLQPAESARDAFTAYMLLYGASDESDRVLPS